MWVEITADCQQSKTTGNCYKETKQNVDLLDWDKKSWGLSLFWPPSLSLSLFLFHRYIADQWACCYSQAVVHHSCWIIHVLRRRGAERGRAYKAKLIKVVVLKVCLCLFQEERKERSVVIPFLSPCRYHSSPRLPPSLASLIPLFPRLSQENYNLTAHFNISASKWVWQALLCVVLSPTPTPFLCPCLHPSTHPSISLPQPPRVVCLSFHRRAQLLPCDRRERGREGEGETEKNKNKSGSNRGLSVRLSGCLSLSFVTRTRPWTYNEERYRFTLMYATHTHTQA